jgi:hypothetical protein
VCTKTPSDPLASQRKFGAVAKAKSRTLSAVKRQVTVPERTGRVFAGSPASWAVMIATGSAEPAARTRRLRWVAVRVTSGLRSTPVAATT